MKCPNCNGTGIDTDEHGERICLDCMGSKEVPDLRKIEKGQVWQHKNGNMYEVLMVTNDNDYKSDKYKPTVVYQNTSNETLWSRYVDDWHRSMALFCEEVG